MKEVNAMKLILKIVMFPVYMVVKMCEYMIVKPLTAVTKTR